MNSFVVNFDPPIVSCVQVEKKASGVVALALPQSYSFKSLNSSFGILCIKKTGILLSFVDLENKCFKIPLKSMIDMGRESKKAKLNYLEFRHFVLIELYKPRFIFCNHSP
jgi:hypothetical protein